MSLKKKSNKKILFIANHRLNRSPGQRFRFEQYLDFFKQNGYECHLSNLLSEQDDKILYKKGNYFQKVIIFLKSYFIRFSDLKKAKANKYDIIFIFREALLNGSSFFEKQFKKTKTKIIFDFDDAIWNLDTSEGNKNLEWLKNPSKTKTNIALSDAVIAGNNYLANYARQFNDKVFVIPTTIDTNYHIPLKTKNEKNTVCIGWTGSHTTIKHFEEIIPVLEKLKNHYGKKLTFKVIGDKNYVCDSLEIKGNAWELSTEIEDLQEIDIGIMPLPNDEWAKGKCGFKGLQYMALEIPAVMSPVGVNTEIIQDGVNGFLPQNEEEWFEVLSRLIDDKQLRQVIGKAGRKTVEEKYSVEANKEKYLSILNNYLA